MVKRTDGNLNLSPGLSEMVKGDHFLQDFELGLKKHLLVVFYEKVFPFFRAPR